MVTIFTGFDVRDLRYVRVFAIAVPSVCLSVVYSFVTLVHPDQGLKFPAIFLHRCVP